MKFDWQAIGESIWKYKLYIGLGIVLIGLALFLQQCGSDYFFRRSIDKKKEAVNAAIQDAKDVQANIDREKEAAKQIAVNVNLAVQDYLEATNTTDATRTNVNAAIERMKQAANVNRNVNAEDVENAMKGL